MGATPQLRTVTLGGGRTLEYAEAGAPGGPPVVFHHGSPASSFLPPGHVAAAEERGLRLVAPSRAGYGGSTRDPDRLVADVVGDTAGLCDALGITRFATAGWSGGGPHAIACAAGMADRCVAAVSLAGVAPYLPDQFDWLEGMGESNVREFELGLAAGPDYDELLAHHRDEMLGIDADALTSVRDLFGDLVSDADVASTSVEDVRYLVRNLRHALADGVGGWRDDDQSFMKPWGFDLADVQVPVAVWYGDQDLTVPTSHGDWLAANLPGVKATCFEGDGHLSVGLGRFAEALDELVALAGGSW